VLATGAVDASTIAASVSSQAQNMDHALLQGALNGSAAVGDKRSNADSAGSQMSRRRVNAIQTSGRLRSNDRNTSKVEFKQYHDHTQLISGPCELDSHANTCVVGSNCVVLEVTEQTVNVSAFTNQHKTFDNVPIVTTATAFDDANTGITYLLIIGQAIYMGSNMNNTLLCPNQLRSNGLIVEDCPRHLSPMNKPSSHSITCVADDLNIPLSLQGVTSYFKTRTPTVNEIETCQWVYLTNERQWDPHSSHFQHQESNYIELEDLPQHRNDRNIYANASLPSSNTTMNTEMANVSEAFDDQYILSIASVALSTK
jgi:hypothetical protein